MTAILMPLVQIQSEALPVSVTRDTLEAVKLAVTSMSAQPKRMTAIRVPLVRILSEALCVHVTKAFLAMV